MKPIVTHNSRNTLLLGMATTLGGVGAMLWTNSRRKRKTQALDAARPNAPGIRPVWAQASAIVARSASELLLLVRHRS